LNGFVPLSSGDGRLVLKAWHALKEIAIRRMRLAMKETNKNYSLGTFILMSLFVIILFPAIIILLSGNLAWTEGWIFSIWFDVMMLSNMIYMYKKNPTLLSERLTAQGSHNQKTWDRYILASLFILAVFWLIAMPLDAQILGLSPRFPLFIKIISCLLLLPALYLLIEATIANPYLSTVVRIQSDRQQKVISTGVYGVVRHPQYLGIIMLLIGGPLLLESIIAIIIGMCIALILIIRINGEEKMLIEELDGYIEYMQKVKYRLLPYIW
jgi:protein-S-isoprenylcysteine O-methyltransferase Ste14